MSKNFKDLVGKMSDESRARVKRSLKKEAKKMGIKAKKAKKARYRLKTTRYLTDKYIFVLTQEFFSGNSSGQFNWALYSMKGHLLRTGGMDGQDPGWLKVKEIRDLGDEEILRYASWLRVYDLMEK